MKATIKDVARVAGVSPSTVSRALHDSPRISEKVRERVKQAAKELDFHPNQMAKSLVSRKTRIVGIVFPGDVSKSLGNPFYPSLLQGLGRAAGERRYHLLLVTGGGEVSAEEASRQAVDSGYVSGLVLLAAEDVPTRDPGVPVVVIGHPRDEAGWHYVDNDNVAAGRAATQHLLAHGHRRILLLGYDRRYIFTVDRRLGYEQALGEAGISARREWIVTSRPIRDPDAGEELAAVFRAADTGDGVLHTHFLRHKAREDINLVAGGSGDQQIGLLHIRLLLHIVAGAVAAYAHHIIDVDDVLNQMWILVDHCDPVLHGQMARQGHAHLARAHNDDLHAVLHPFFRRDRFRWGSSGAILPHYSGYIGKSKYLFRQISKK